MWTHIERGRRGAILDAMDYHERANEIFAIIREIAATIPGYRAPVSATEMRELIRQSTVPPEFVEQVAVAVEASADLAKTDLLDPADARDAGTFGVFCDLVAQEFEIVARGIRYAGMRRLAATGSSALQVFAFAKSLNRRGTVVPHVEAMREALRSRKRKR
jgi:hypothetical protein